MKIVVAGVSAYDAMRRMRNERIPLRIASTPRSHEMGCTVGDVEDAELGELATSDHPLHIMVPKGTPHSRSGRIRQHIWDGELPEGCLLETDVKDVLVQAPPLAALTLSRRWPVSWLTMFTCEMCCDISTAGDDKRFLQREALSSVSDFMDLLPVARGRYGAKAFRKAVAAAGDGCASPLEFETRAILCLPVEDGAFGTGRPTSNLCVTVTEPDGTHRVRYLDLGWELDDALGRRIIKGVEVDGGQHNRNDVRTGDHLRSYELRSSDIEELRVTSAILSSQERIAKFGNSVRHMLGMDNINMTRRRVQARAALVQSIEESPWHLLHLDA